VHRFLCALPHGAAVLALVLAMALLFLPGAACAPDATDAKAAPPKPKLPACVTENGCHVCHKEQATEMLQSKHIHKGIGCVKCHGPSEKHKLTAEKRAKPTRTFTHATAEEWCNSCHEAYCPHAQTNLRIPPEKRKTCPDCHGPHTAVIRKKTPPAKAPAKSGT